MLKPGKDPIKPSKYRPIALTSVLCKVMERMVNVRLLDFFDQKGTLSTLQCGGRAKRTTIGHLLSVEATVINQTVSTSYPSSSTWKKHKT